jgi:hypothetical protein
VNTPDKLQEIIVSINQHRFVSAAKQLPITTMPAVESLGVDTIDVAHASGYVGIWGLEKEMIMVCNRRQCANSTTLRFL